MAFDPRQARWDRVEVPACQGARPAVVRTSAPASFADAPPDALLADITAGLTQRFPQVLPIEVRADPPETPRGSVRLLHAAVDPDGVGIAIETLLLRGGDIACWVAPAARYAAEREAARRAMAGRPPLWREETAAPDGAPVAEMRLTVAGPGEGDWVIVRHGPLARVLPASPAEPADAVELPASLLPVWLASVTGTGPRPLPGGRPMLILARSALDRFIGLTDTGLTAAGPADVRTALDAADLADADAAELGAFAGGLGRRWSLEWISGRADAAGPGDAAPSETGPGETGPGDTGPGDTGPGDARSGEGQGDAGSGDESPRLEGRGRLEILDAGPSHGLWRVLTGLPEALTSDLAGELPDECPVGLVRTAPADVWHELTLPLAG
jgi:hypothetical protein